MLGSSQPSLSFYSWAITAPGNGFNCMTSPVAPGCHTSALEARCNHYSNAHEAQPGEQLTGLLYASVDVATNRRLAGPLPWARRGGLYSVVDGSGATSRVAPWNSRKFCPTCLNCQFRKPWSLSLDVTEHHKRSAASANAAQPSTALSSSR